MAAISISSVIAIPKNVVRDFIIENAHCCTPVFAHRARHAGTTRRWGTGKGFICYSIALALDSLFYRVDCRAWRGKVSARLGVASPAFHFGTSGGMSNGCVGRAGICIAGAAGSVDKEMSHDTHDD